MIVKNADILTSDGVVSSCHMVFDKKIISIDCCDPESLVGVSGMEQVVDGSGLLLVPGLIDIHTHGGAGVDFSDGKGENMDILSRHYAAAGVTAWCPTTMTLPLERLEKIAAPMADYKNPVAAKPVGIYVEGPFFHWDKRGAQSGKYLAMPNLLFYETLQKVSGNHVKLWALAPELEGAMDFIEKVTPDIKVTLAHTTTDYATAQEAFAKGATQVTHLFNAMNPLTHREPGLIGAGFASEAYIELICDGQHVHPTVVKMAHKIFGKKMCFITDSLRCAGMPDGEYELTGQTVIKKDGVARLPCGTLAGAAIGLLEGVRNLISFGLSPEDAFYGASTAPAHALGMEDEIGSLEVGKSADFLLVDEDYQLVSTYVNGKCVYHRGDVL